MACPYESYVPIDKPSIKINPELLGEWKGGDGKDSLKERIVFSIKDNFTYNIDYFGKDTAHFIGYFSDVDKERFMNMKEITGKKDNPPAYNFFRVFLTADNFLYFLPVSDKKLKTKFSDSEKLKEYIQKNKSSDFFYENPFWLEKMRK